jgi:hypothetical protein
VKLLVPLPALNPVPHSTPAVVDVPLVGVTLAADDAGPVPALFVAATVQPYATPLVSPPTVIGLAAPFAVTVAPPPVHATV